MSDRSLTSKILAAHGIEDLTPGSFGLARVDRVMLNDVSGALAIREFERIGSSGVFDAARIACVADHFSPAKDVISAAHLGRLRRFVDEYGIDDYWEVGATYEAGIEHAVLAEQGRVLPGDLLVGGDSHTCTNGALGALAIGMGSTDLAAAMATGEVWLKVPPVVEVSYSGTRSRFVTGKDYILALIAAIGVDGATYSSLEFTGEAVADLNIDERMALCNMAVETGAKSGIVAADDQTISWLAGRHSGLDRAPIDADAGARYEQRVDLNVADMGPLVALPPSPGNVSSIEDLGDSVRVNQVYVGNCANGTLTDLMQLASILRGQRVAKGTRLIVVPATQRIYRAALANGTIDVLLEAGALLSPPTCGACFGGHMGVLDANEVAVATTNRNFRGRMGHPESRVYLANAFVAGAAAVAGELIDPAEVAPPKL